VIGMEKRGLSFGFYHHQSWIDQSVKLTDFMKIFVTEWNYLRSALCNKKVADPRLEYLLKHLLHDTSFLNAFSVASDFNLINHSLPVD
jgi:site-specific recombinase